MTYSSKINIMIVALMLTISGCMSYGFSGASIPPELNTIFIPFFPDQSSSGLGDLSNRLNRALVNRFVNQSRLSLVSDVNEADVALEGFIQSYENRPFSVTGDDESDLNQVSITVSASFKHTNKDKPEWDRTFRASFRFDPNINSIENENNAADDALETIAQNMFNEAVGGW